MNIVERKVELVSKQPYDEMIKENELAIRNCYKSEDKITDDSAERMVRMMIKSGHEAMIEFADLTFHIVADRSVLAQLSRHRLMSLAVESQRYCVAGNMALKTSNEHNKLTIEELYENKVNSKNGSWKRMRIEQLDENTGELVYNKISDIVYNGKMPVYRLKTLLGYELVCTSDHRIYTIDGYKKLGDLNVGDCIYVNGNDVACDKLYLDKDWLYYQSVTLNKCYTDIAKEFGFNVSTVKKWAYRFDLPSKGMGNHKKMIPWNKGLDKSDYRIKNMVDALNAYHFNGKNDVKLKKLNNNSNYRKFISNRCSICGSTDNLIVHHIDKNRENNDVSNLITLCSKCHTRLHSKNLNILYSDKIVSIEYVGIKNVYDIEMNSNYHNFIANGVVVHNCNYSKDKFNHSVNFIIPCNLKNYDKWETFCSDAEETYFDMIEHGDKAEVARSVLPNCVATSIYVRMNMRELRHFLGLRLSNHAQADIRDIANQMYNLVREHYPVYVEDLTIEGVNCHG